MGDEHSGLYTTSAGTSFLHDNGETPLLPNVDVQEPGNGLGQLSDALLGMLRRWPKPFTKITLLNFVKSEYPEADLSKIDIKQHFEHWFYTEENGGGGGKYIFKKENNTNFEKDFEINAVTLWVWWLKKN